MSPVERLDADRWRLLSPYLDQALDLSSADRQRWLKSLDANDPAMADDVRDLLAQDDVLERRGFLAGTVPSARALADAEPCVGQTLGAYTLTAPISRGGMGTVWLAERNDGRFTGHVAMKFLNASLFGREGEKRFAREGSILARLTHPSIAHLLDAGVSPSGQPYLVLEYVRGQHIDRYCDDQQLDVDARLHLFLEVLAAVAHAHANLVVHRDIKPSNVLIAANGDQAHAARARAAHVPGAHVKLLDFGIAKLLESDTSATLLTRDGALAMTPAFAAPEQLTGQPVTTATDVYSLGVLLYILLGGQHPVVFGRMSPAEAVQAVVSIDTPRLSEAVVATAPESAEALAASAARRRTTPERLQRLLQGDLDTIVAKALKKDPQERYASVTALADDVRRHLDHLPIAARPDSFAYRGAKFARRQRVPVALASLAIVALIVGMAGTITQARRATREARLASEQRDFALRQGSRTEAVGDLDTFLLSDTAPATAFELLGRAERILGRQQETDENHIEMLVSIGRQYFALDQHDKALAPLTTAYELSRQVSDGGTRARASCALAATIARTGDLARAQHLLREGLDALPNEPQYVLSRVFCDLRGADISDADPTGAGRSQAIVQLQSARRLLKASGLSSPFREFRLSAALAKAYAADGRYKDALPAYEEAAALLASLGRDDTGTAATLYDQFGVALAQVGRPRDAESQLRRATPILTRAEVGGHPARPVHLHHLARTLSDLHRLPDAAVIANDAFENARCSEDDQLTLETLITRAAIARQTGDVTMADRVLTAVESLQKRIEPAPEGLRAPLAAERALLAQARGDLPAALASMDRAVALAEAARAPSVSRLLVQRSRMALQHSRAAQAHADATRALALALAAIDEGARSCDVGRAYLALGRALEAQQQRAGAHAAFAAALDHLTPTLGPDHPDTHLARTFATGTTDAAAAAASHTE